ncbi:MAG: hypothetical protein WCJ95_12925 [Mariniphaga sp.]
MPQHIKRLISVFAIFILLFLVMRQVLKPSSFGKLGHFRADAIYENTLKPMHYTIADSCTKCHKSVRAEKDKGFHKHLKCEVCHGPGLKHSLFAEQFKGKELPDSLKLYKPGERKDCGVCHQKNAARIKIQFDTINTTMVHQIDLAEHNPPDLKANEPANCIDCHNPHQP